MQIILTTTAYLHEAESIASKLVESRLAACVQIVPPITSVYVWEGEIRKEKEHLLLIKTLPEKWDQVCEMIKANHNYDVPEIAAIDVENVSEPYLSWLRGVIDI
jgi:periplasmic divalent cation tolerance protein